MRIPVLILRFKGLRNKYVRYLILLNKSFDLIRDAVGKMMNRKLLIFTPKPRAGKMPELSQ